jgi:DNA (cytosine-5)-methyltransferase 1
MKILNLYAGIGGNRKLWGDEHEITAVENNVEIAMVYKKFYPKDTMIIGDAITVLMSDYKKFDFIWVSPPCQTHSKMRYLASKKGDYLPKLPDMILYSLIIWLKHFCSGKLWCVENVKPYYDVLIKPNVVLDRHFIWANFDIEKRHFDKADVKHNKVTGKTDRFGICLRGIPMKHRKDQIIRNCVNPLLALHILNEADRWFESCRFTEAKIKEVEK